MKFSVIVPVYNTELYLEECLESLVSQRYDDFEVILVNDGSIDSSLSICERYTCLYPDLFQCVSQANRGLFAARKTGALLANGDYLVALDSDDTLHSDALRRLDASIRRTGAQVICYGMSKCPDYSSGISPISEHIGDGAIPKHAMKLLVCSSPYVNTICGKAISRRLMLKCYQELEDKLQLSMAEDLLQTIHLVDKAESYSVVSDFLYYYRDNQASITKKYRRANTADSNYVYGELMAYAAKWKSEDGHPYVEYAASTVLCAFGALAQAAVETLQRDATTRELNYIAKSRVFALAAKHYMREFCDYRFDKILMGRLLLNRQFFLLKRLADVKAVAKKITNVKLIQRSHYE